MADQQRNISKFSPLLSYKTGYNRVSFKSDRKRKRSAKDEKEILRKHCTVLSGFPMTGLFGKIHK